MSNPYNPSKLSKVLFDECKKICANVFPARPISTTQTLDKFIVVSAENSLINNGAYGYTRAKISIYIKEVTRGGTTLPNMMDLEKMTDDVYSLFPINSNNYLFYHPIAVDGGYDKKGYYVYHLITKVIIK